MSNKIPEENLVAGILQQKYLLTNNGAVVYMGVYVKKV